MLKTSWIGRTAAIAICALVLLMFWAPPAKAQSPWAPGVSYAVGALVTYNGATYRCLQAHTSEAGWEPATTPALWQLVTSGGGGGGGTCKAAPGVPTGLAAAGTTSSGTTLSWKAVTPPTGCSITGYTVYQNGASIGTASGTSFSVSGLAPSTAYSFSVAASDSSGSSTPSAVIHVTTLAGGGGGGGTCAPVWNASTAYNGGATASLNGVNYTADYWSQGASPDRFNGPAGSGEPWTSTGSCSGGGGGGGTSCKAAPAAPTGLAASGTTSSSTNLKWTAPAPPANCTISGYTVYQNGIIIGTSTGASFAVSGLAASTAYTFAVAASDSAGASPESAAVKITTPGTGGGGGTGPFAKMGYFVQWGIYGRGYDVNNLVTTGAINKLTHILYAFENIDPVNLTCFNGVVKATSSNPEDPSQGDGAGDAFADYDKSFTSNTVNGQSDTYNQPLRGNFNQLKELKAAYPNVKILLSLGGWTYSKYFSDVAATDASRKKFVNSCIAMYITGNLPAYDGVGGPGSAAGIFDGFDIDWEWPGGNFGHPGNHFNATSDKENLVLLLQEFRKELDALGTGHHPLTAFAPADTVKLASGWDLTQLPGIVDFLNVQGYDFHGAGSDNSWEPNMTGNSSQLYQAASDPHPNDFTVDRAMQMYLKAGVSSKKVNMGIPFYAHGWQGVAAGSSNGDWSTATGAACGQFGCDNLDASTWNTNGPPPQITLAAAVPGCTQFFDAAAGATWCFTGNGGQFWSYDDAKSLAMKMSYVKNFNLGGIFIWEMSGDSGSLMTAIDSGLK